MRIKNQDEMIANYIGEVSDEDLEKRVEALQLCYPNTKITADYFKKRIKIRKRTKYDR